MSNLVTSKIKESTGGRQGRRDLARELAEKYPDKKELTIQILSLMNLHRRDRRDIWYPYDTKLRPLEWLQKAFMDINNGRHPEFSLPQRIEVVIQDPLFDNNSLNVRIVDTKGIDGATSRADLDRLFDDPRTLVVLCSRFNDAPELSLQDLLQRVKDAGASDIAQKTIILVLPRPEEAIAVKDDSGIQVEDEQEGYDLKRYDVNMRLSQLGLQTMSVEFFNALQDDVTPLRSVVIDQLYGIRGAWARQIDDLSKNVDDLIANRDKEQTAIIFRQVLSQLKTWISKNRNIEDIAEQIQQQLVSAIQRSHWRSVQASVRRKGNWYNLDYYHELGFGARIIAAKYLKKKVSEFDIIVQNLLDNPDLAPAYDLLDQVKRMLRSRTDDLLKKMEIVGKAEFEDDLEGDFEFWNRLYAVSGSGYLSRIASSSDGWFKIESRMEKHVSVKAKIVEGWREVLSELDALFEQVAEYQ
jgi:hypothetical protein